MKDTDSIEVRDEITVPMIALSVEEASMAIPACEAEIWKALRDRKLKAKKNGRRIIIPVESIKEWLNGLPDYQPGRVFGNALKHRKVKEAADATT